MEKLAEMEKGSKIKVKPSYIIRFSITKGTYFLPFLLCCLYIGYLSPPRSKCKSSGDGQIQILFENKFLGQFTNS